MLLEAKSIVQFLLLFEYLLLRYISATALLFSPIFFANLIYSTLIRDTAQANVSFGASLLRAMLGGSFRPKTYSRQVRLICEACKQLLILRTL